MCGMFVEWSQKRYTFAAILKGERMDVMLASNEIVLLSRGAVPQVKCDQL